MEHITGEIITGLVSVIVGILGGGGLVKLLDWIRKPNDQQNEDLREEKEKLRTEKEELRDEVERERDKAHKQTKDFIKRLEGKVEHLEARLEERGEEYRSILEENLRLKAGKPPP